MHACKQGAQQPARKAAQHDSITAAAPLKPEYGNNKTSTGSCQRAKLAKMQPPSCAHCAPPHAELTDTPAALQTHVPNPQPHHTRRNAPGLSQQFSSQCASQSRIMVHTRERLRRSAATHAPARQSGGWYRERTPTQPQLTAAAATAGVLNVICMAHQVR